MKALIAAGGRATRLRPITWTTNKHLIPLANKPMIFYAIEKIVAAGIHDIVISVNPGDTELEERCGDGARWGARIRYIEQEGGARGVAHVPQNAAHLLRGEPFLYYLGDNVLVGDLAPMVERYRREGLDCLLAFSRVRDPERFGVPEFDAMGRLIRVVEKPTAPSSDFAVTGLYLYNDRYFDAFRTLTPSIRGEFEISELNTWFINHGTVGWQEVTGWWKDTGKPEDLLEGNQLILDEMVQDETYNGATIGAGVVIQGKVKIGKGTEIGDRVLIRGPAVVGDGCVIKNSYIGPYTAVGNEVTIHNTEIEHSIIFDHVHVNCNSRIVDSIVGYNASVISAQQSLPLGHKLVVGDNSVVEL